MKRLFIFSIACAALSLASCKKDRTCECTQTTVYGGGGTDVSTSTVTVKEIKKSEAKDICQKTTSMTTTSGGTSTTTNDCKLK